MTLLERLGPARGYYPEPAKSIIIYNPANMAAAKTALDRFDFRYQEGARYVGGFIGTAAAQKAWLAPKIDEWVEGIKALALIARNYPQAAYAGLSKSLQAEWQYMHRVIDDVGAHFGPIEDALATVFLIPALLGGRTDGDQLRDLFTLPVRQAGLNLPDPAKRAVDGYRASLECTKALAASLIARSDLDAVGCAAIVTEARSQTRKTKALRGLSDLKTLCNAKDKFVSRRMLRSTETGSWLNNLPNSLNGTVLSEEEFRDSLRLRFGLAPLRLPSTCDGCGKKLNFNHAQICKKGGLILHHHDDVADEWGEMCARALKPSAVADKPLIHTGRDNQMAAGSTDAPINKALRGDVGVHGFWKKQQSTIFDVRITDTDCTSSRDQDPRRILAQQEQRDKKKTYSVACTTQRRHFTPLVFSVDGMVGMEAQAAIKRLASLLSAKWKRPYAETCTYVRSRISISLVRAASHCLRGSRDRTARVSYATWETGTGMGLYR